ncbi:MAG: radical SAM protein [Eubacteriales bacterium]|nr:radical SAM protein [Eubacteriales bacterium]MDD3881540.1 radical SAM protein [Eubacteriales bacterium]MDD4513390.1 radical SAM protein [Eubacteriales bacterium]
MAVRSAAYTATAEAFCYQNPDFDNIYAKENAISILDDEMRKKRKKGIIRSGSACDPYNSLEPEAKLTAASLELMKRYGFGFGILTKSDLILRDKELLSSIADVCPSYAAFTLTTADDSLAARIEMGAPRPSARLSAMRELSALGIFTGTMMTPTLPYITDSIDTLKSVIEKTAENGGRFVISYAGMTLRDGNREYYYNALREISPSLPLQYAKEYGSAYQVPVSGAENYLEKHRELCRQYGLLYSLRAVREAVRAQGTRFEQLSLI